MKRIATVFAWFCLVLSLHAQVVENKTIREDSTHALREVSVFGQQGKAIVPSQRLNGQQLESLSAFSVADAIRYFSGVQLKDYGGVGGLKTVDIRSMGTHHMGVFYDGIQLGNAQNGQIDLGKFSLDNVEEISLYNGQKSEIFQSAKDYGSSGTIYIRTRRPRFAEGKNYNVKATFKSGSFGLVNPSLLWEQQWTPRISSSFSGEFVTATGEYPFRYRRVLSNGTVAWDTTATRQNGDIQSLRLEGAVFGKMDKGVWTAKAYYYDSERGLPGAIVNNVWKREQRQWDRNFFTQASLKRFESENYEWQVNAKYARDFMHYLNPDTTLLYIDNHFTQREAYVSTAHHVTLSPRWDVNLSADYQWNTLDADLKNFVEPQRHTLFVALASTYELWRFRLMGSLLGTHVFEQVKREGARKPDNQIQYTPALFATCYPLRGNKDLSLRAFYKRIFRMPTFNDLYYTDIGNVALKPEFTTQYNLGLFYQHEWAHGLFRHFETKVDGYFNKVDNKIIAVPKGNGQYRWMMMNLGYVEIRGIDVTAQTVLRPHRDWMLNLCANYTYQKAQDFSDPTDNDPVMGTYGGQIAYIPWHSGSLTTHLEWAVKSRGKHIGNLGLNYSYIYTGERYHVSANIPANHEEPWYTSDLGVSYDFRLQRLPIEKIRLSLECNNLFDQQYDVVLNYPMPGRNWKVTLKIDV